MLSKEEMKRYMKQVMLDDIGINGQIKLKQAKVAVVGAGGLGCPVLQYLGAMGIGTIGVIDFDVVDESNLHRQVLYTSEDVGKKKVDVAIERVSKQNPFITLIKHDVMLDENNAKEIFKDYDFVIDGCDNFMTRYAVNDICVALNKALVYGSILGYEGQLAVFNYNGSKNLRDIFPEPPNAEDVPSCSENGVLGIVPGIIGNMMAQEAVNMIMETPSLLNSLAIVNCRFHTINKIQF
ncbi:MAG: HesA/MoeB/ThiF family protein [Bacteroidota bacterium]|nr:HesA/MoeB/ThiF family protein [Bacteroidota bacterium]